MNYVIWKNKDSTDIVGLKILDLPPITKPKMRVIETEIDGVDGSIIEDLGYESYDKSINIGLVGNYDVDEILDYFDGEGQIIFSNESDKYYNAKIINRIDYERLIRFRTATVKFRVQPYKYKVNENTYTLTDTEHRVINLGLTKSKPLLIINGNGDIEVSLNSEPLFTYTFHENETEVYIDSEKQDAYLGNTLKNRQMNGEFPMLNVGVNEITWTGNVTSIKVYPRSRWK